MRPVSDVGAPTSRERAQNTAQTRRKRELQPEDETGVLGPRPGENRKGALRKRSFRRVLGYPNPRSEPGTAVCYFFGLIGVI